MLNDLKRRFPRGKSPSRQDAQAAVEMIAHLIDYAREDLAASELADLLFPYDGPHEADRIATAAAMIPRLVRYLNNATQSRPRWANTIDSVVGSLTSARDLAPQLREQLVRHLVEMATDPTLYDDRYSTDHYAPEVALRAADALRIGDLDTARSLLVHLGNRPEDVDKH